MGMGLEYKCRSCGKRYQIYPGMGMLYPHVYQELLLEIKDGKHGKERQRVCLETPQVAINAQNVVFLCKECGKWRAGKDLTLYAPDDLKNQEDENHIPYDISKGYHVVLEYVKKCGKCREPMKIATDEEMQHLSCPKCGEPNEPRGYIMWD